MAKQKNVSVDENVQPEVQAISELPVEVQVEEITVEAPQFDFILRVVNPFKDYKKASEIRDAFAIQAVIDDGDLPNCVKVSTNSRGIK